MIRSILSLSLALATSQAIAGSSASYIEELQHKFKSYKLQSRAELLYGKKGPSNKSVDRYTDYYMYDFFGDGGTYYRNVNWISDQNLHEGKIEKDIWTGSYWPLRKGGIAHRYRSRSGNSGSFDRNYDRRQWPMSLSQPGYIDDLSPAEKYDLLVGDDEFSLTNFEWQRGKVRADIARIESWEGHCNGWSIASVKEKRPLKAVKVKSSNGQDIIFYPSDIKALSTAMWSNLMTYKKNVEEQDVIQMAGRDCRVSRRMRRGERELHCIDTNPGIWHIIMVNTLGLKGQTVTFDVAADSETWNHPIKSYSYEFFNPNRRSRTSTKVQDVVQPVSQIRRDRYQEYRSPETKYIVGVNMDVEYYRLGRAHTDSNEEVGDSRVSTKSYRYDLELDEHFRIIGGEWHQRNHPDFVWRTAPELDGSGPADEYLYDFDLTRGQFPSDWSAQVKKSSRHGIPSAQIVRKLIEMAQ